ncbi:MAG: VWA domain-containing protein, partial [Anaerolineales bacterium]|nr:VWA domain-containing protein [Anaerolineales bacterium]
MKIKISLLALVCLALLIPAPARADGIIIPLPPICPRPPCPPPPCPWPPCPQPSPMIQLVIRYHKVTVDIQEQIATTHIDQVFYNPNDWEVEGEYTFPLPEDAVVSSFELWVDGEPVQGQALDAEQARRKYEEMVRSLRDPALLEYADRGAFQAHVFPIPAQGERRIELEYSQALPAENGLVRYVYPLNTEKFSAWPLEQVSVNVDIRASAPIRAVYSPSHKVEVSRESQTHVRAGYEDSQALPDTDFALYYSLGEQEALHLLSYRSPNDEDDPDGFFLLLLAPRPQVNAAPMPKDVVLVLDRSGSMEGEKFQQAQDALVYILEHLNPDDRFNVIAFSTGLDSYASRLRAASEAAQAIEWVERLGAQGSTDINRALLEAASLVERERPTYLIFLTDGLPTEGVVDSQQILDNLASVAADNLRLFAFGVGYDVDTFLLDSLAQAHHGASSYVLPSEQLDEVLSAFYAKVSTPVLTDLSLDFGDLRAYDLYPSPLPDLFSGSQIILVGRYRQGGTTTILLNGQVEGKTQTFRFPEQVFAAQSAPEYPLNTLPRLWATRKIGYLLNRIRLEGPDQETIEQIVRLSVRYGIVTPYTSYLVSESPPLSAADQERTAVEQAQQMRQAPAAPAFGQAAVEKAIGQGSLASADAPLSPVVEGAANQVRIAGSKAFVFDGERWVDTTFDSERMQTVKVAFLSDEYFALASSRPELAAAFALGEAVIALSEGVAYEVVSQGAPVEAIQIPPTHTAAPAGPATPIAVASAPAAAAGTPQAAATPIPFAPPGAAPCLGGLLAGLLLWLPALARLGAQ